MAIQDLQIKVQGLEGIDATLGTATTAAIAKISTGKFIPNLISDSFLLTQAMAAFTKFGAQGSDIITMLDREALIHAGQQVAATDVLDKNNLGSSLKAIEILARIDTVYEARFHIESNDIQYGNPEKVQQLVGDAYRNYAAEFIDNINCDLINLCIGGVAKSSDGRDIASQITPHLNSTLGKATNDEGYKTNWRKLRKTINDKIKQFTKTGRFTSIKDFTVLLALDVYNEFSVAMERYTEGTVRNMITGEVQGLIVNGIKVMPTNYLQNTFTKTNNKINEITVYDFSKIDAIIVHNQALFVKMWSLMDAYVFTKDGHFYHTLRSGYGVKDGVLRPYLIDYYTSGTTKTVAK